MLRKDMLSFEEMDKREGLVDTDEENICYRIEDEIEWLKKKGRKGSVPGNGVHNS